MRKGVLVSPSIPLGEVAVLPVAVDVAVAALSPTVFASFSTSAAVELVMLVNDRAHISSTRILRCCNGGIEHPSRSCTSIMVA